MDDCIHLFWSEVIHLAPSLLLGMPVTFDHACDRKVIQFEELIAKTLSKAGRRKQTSDSGILIHTTQPTQAQWLARSC